MIPFECMPGAKHWAGSLPKLVAHPGPIWVYGPFGSGVSTVAQWLAAKRGSEAFEFNDGAIDLKLWLKNNPTAVVASEKAISVSAGSELHGLHDFMELQLLAIGDDPSVIRACIEHLAAEEGIQAPFPAALMSLPCGGNLKELRNRLIRWNTIGQLPEPRDSDAELLEAEDIASNLHILERILLFRALRRSYGNRAEAAKRLCISRRQLYLLIERHGDPVRGAPPTSASLKRLTKVNHNSVVMPSK